jgi:hypothetical protein
VAVTSERIAKDGPDQLVVNGIAGDGAIVSFQIRGGMTRGTAFLFEIYGERACCLYNLQSARPGSPPGGTPRGKRSQELPK